MQIITNAFQDKNEQQKKKKKSFSVFTEFCIYMYM